MTKKKTKAQLDAEIDSVLPLSKRIPKGLDPHTKAGGRAMMQSINMGDIARLAANPRKAARPPGTKVTVTMRLIGGNVKVPGTVVWDDGRGKVSVDLQGGYGTRRTEEDSEGNLFAYN